MRSINVFTLSEVKKLKKAINIPGIKGKKVGRFDYVLTTKTRMYNDVIELVEPTPEQLIEAGIITAEEYRNSLI